MNVLTQWLTRRVEFPYQGKAWRLVFTYRVLFRCQEMTGKDMLAEDMANPSASLVRALLYSALLEAGAQCSIENVGKALGRVGIPAARKKVIAAWLASMPDPEPESQAAGEEEASDPQFGWMDVWAVARELHGLAPADWLDMTPRMFYALQKVRLDQMRREELLVGMLCATSANFSFCRPEQPISAESFMLHKFPEGKKKDSGPVTGEMIMAKMKPRIIRKR